MHTLRARNQEVAKTDIFSSLSSNAVLIILDWAMKYLPRKFREDNCDWFAKRGIPWHISVVFRKNPELESIAYIHLFDSNVVQGSATTTAVILDVAQSIKHQFPEINSFHLWSDNAGCYKSSETIQTLFCSKLFASYDFCEMQDGKGACDRIAATIKSAIRRYVNEGHDVVSPLQFKQVIVFCQSFT